MSAVALLATQRFAVAQQQSRIWKVGFLVHGQRFSSADQFIGGMRELGYQVGKNLVIEWRFSEGQVDRLPALAADLVSRKVDVIVCSSTPSTRAAKATTSTVPIVMALVGDPIGSGFIASYARPGGNITGLSLANIDISLKWFEFARLVAPGSQVGILADSNQPTHPPYVRNIQGEAQKLGARAPVAYASGPKDFEGALASLAKERVTAVIVLPSGPFENGVEQIARIALKHRMASIATTRSYVERGALISYGQSYAAFARRAATYVDKILKGAKPSDLPVEQPAYFELVVNKATARKLNLAIPDGLLLRADVVIE